MAGLRMWDGKRDVHGRATTYLNRFIRTRERPAALPRGQSREQSLNCFLEGATGTTGVKRMIRCITGQSANRGVSLPGALIKYP